MAIHLYDISARNPIGGGNAFLGDDAAAPWVNAGERPIYRHQHARQQWRFPLQRPEYPATKSEPTQHRTQLDSKLYVGALDG